MRTTLLLMLTLATTAFAESATDKVKATTNEVKRTVKKDAHRVEEALCTGTKAECAKKKVEHRLTEAKDAVVDKVDETVH